MVIILSTLVLVSGLVDIVADYAGSRRVVYTFKPLTLVLLLLMAFLAPGPAPAAYRLLIAAGLVFSLGGDVLLMLPSKPFVPGLVSFLVAQLFYTAAFVTGSGFRLSLPVALPCAVYFVVLLRILLPHAGRMKLPITLYGLAIVTMVWQAAERWAAVPATGALLAAAGAVLFAISDSGLAINRFVRPFRASQAVVLGTYFVAQLLITLSVWYPLPA